MGAELAIQILTWGPPIEGGHMGVDKGPMGWEIGVQFATISDVFSNKPKRYMIRGKGYLVLNFVKNWLFILFSGQYLLNMFHF